MASQGNRSPHPGNRPSPCGSRGKIRGLCHPAPDLFQLWNHLSSGNLGAVGGSVCGNAYHCLRLDHGRKGSALEAQACLLHHQQSFLYSDGRGDDESPGSGCCLKPYGLPCPDEDLFLLLRRCSNAPDQKNPYLRAGRSGQTDALNLCLSYRGKPVLSGNPRFCRIYQQVEHCPGSLWTGTG